jgi:hypothetical protein
MGAATETGGVHPPTEQRVGEARANMFKATMMAISLLAMTAATGCAIHTQGPVKEVAYDFSDHDFYDRSYAPSPDYGTAVASADADDAADDAADAKAKQTKDEGDDADTQVVVIVGKSGKVTIEQGGNSAEVDPKGNVAVDGAVVDSGDPQAEAPAPPQPRTTR